MENSTAERMLKILLDDLKKLYDNNTVTTWEYDFLHSINDQIADGRTMSKKQTDVLQKIYDKAY